MYRHTPGRQTRPFNTYYKQACARLFLNLRGVVGRVGHGFSAASDWGQVASEKREPIVRKRLLAIMSNTANSANSPGNLTDALSGF